MFSQKVKEQCTCNLTKALKLVPITILKMLLHTITTSKAMNARPASTKKWLISTAADPGESRQTFGSVSGLQIFGVFEIAVVD